MDPNDSEDLVRITHYINPHMFWFKYESSYFINSKFFDLDNKIQEYYRSQKNVNLSKYTPEVDEIAGVFHFDWNRWIRVKVDFIAEFAVAQRKYIVWAIDDGVPLTVEARNIRKLPPELAVDTDLVHFGGVANIIPAEKRYNFITNCPEMVQSENWSRRGVKIIEDLINDAASTKFIKHKITADGHWFGNLEIITHSNQIKNVKKVLLDIDRAILVTDNFFQILRKIRTNKMSRWQRNDGNASILNQTVKYSAKSHERNSKVLANKYIDYKNEYALTVEQKISDWDERNRKSKVNYPIDNIDNIDDVAFSDSASRVCNIDIVTNRTKQIEVELLDDDKDEDVPVYNVGGSKRKELFEKYRQNVPHFPEEDFQPKIQGEKNQYISQLVEMEKQFSNLVVSNVSQDENVSNNCLPTTSLKLKSEEKESISPINDKIVIPSSTEKSDIPAGNNSIVSSTNSNISSSAIAAMKNRLRKGMVETNLTASKNDTNRAKRIIIPAGFDLRNLQPAKNFKSTNSSTARSNTKVTSKSSTSKNDMMCKICSIQSDQQPVLVHGKCVAKPIKSLRNANFCTEVHQWLEEMRFLQIYRIQKYAWPHLMRGNSLIVVNSGSSGKTISYLPAICSLIKTKVTEGLVENGAGPIGIIIAHSSVAVEKIANDCRRCIYSNNIQNYPVVECYGLNQKTSAIHLWDGCEILVATPSSLARLIKSESKLFNKNRIQHLVIDNIDLINKNLFDDLHFILRKCCGFNENGNKMSPQIVVTTETWNKQLLSLCDICNNPELCIGSYIEAAVYSKSRILTKFVKKTSKSFEILDFLKKHNYREERLMIICNKDEEVDEVTKVLNDASYSHVACTARSTAVEIESTHQWHDLQTPDMTILVCTDSILKELKVGNTQNVIHYSLPETWTIFSFRFSVFFYYYDDLVKTKTSTKPRASSLILLDENNNSQLPKLVDFLEKHSGNSIPSEVLSVARKIRIQKEEERILDRKEFCPYIMEFGQCFRENYCDCRHVLTKYDKPNENLPNQGQIKLKVLTVRSPIHYCVRLLEHKLTAKNSKWEPIKNSANYLKFNLEFSNYFADSKHHKVPFPLKLNDMYVVNRMGTFYRCKILDLSKQEKSISVKLLDVGEVIKCRPTKIFVLPEQFRDFPIQAIDIRLTGILPNDFEIDWDSKSISNVKRWIEEGVSDSVHVEANISFTLMDTIWVDSIILVKKLESISSFVNLINIKKELLEKNFGIINNEVTNILLTKAQECGILTSNSSNSANNSSAVIETTSSSSDIDPETVEKSIHKYEPLNVSMSSSISHSSKDSDLIRANKYIRKPRQKTYNIEKWETLKENELTCIHIGAFYTPNIFYIQNLANVEKMEILYAEINKFALETNERISEPKIGLNCIANTNGNYNRGKITKIICDANDNEIKVNVFFCDIGTTEVQSIHDILPSNDKLVRMMPFQSIRCKLTGIIPLSNGIWTEDVCDSIYDEIIDKFDLLYVRPVGNKSNNTLNDLCYSKYDVILLDSKRNDYQILNQLIVEKGFAYYDSETKHFFDIIINSDNTSSEESNKEEDNWDSCNYQRNFISDQNLNTSAIDFDNLLDMDVQFTEEEVLQLLNLPPTAKIIPIIEENELDSKITESEDIGSKNNICDKSKESEKSLISSSEVELSECKSNLSENKNIVLILKNLYKTPQTLWEQSDSLISLSISAPNVDDYILKVTSTNMILIFSLDSVVNVIVLNLFGCIDANLTSHEIRGLRIIVRLVKSLKALPWPRLSWEADKLPWLKYNYDAIRVDDKKICNIVTGKFYDSRELNDDSSSDTDDSDEDFDFTNTYYNNNNDPFQEL